MSVAHLALASSQATHGTNTAGQYAVEEGANGEASAAVSHTLSHSVNMAIGEGDSMGDTLSVVPATPERLLG